MQGISLSLRIANENLCARIDFGCRRQELPGLPRTAQERPGVPRSVQECPGAPRSAQERPGVPKSAQERPGVPRRALECSGALRGAQACPGVPRSTQARQPEPQMFLKDRCPDLACRGQAEEGLVPGLSVPGVSQQKDRCPDLACRGRRSWTFSELEKGRWPEKLDVRSASGMTGSRGVGRMHASYKAKTHWAVK